MTISTAAAARMRGRLDYLRANAGKLVVDGDVHPTDGSALPAAMAAHLSEDSGYFHGRPLLSEHLLVTMDRADVDMALCWQNPAALPYVDSGEENTRLLAASNDRIAALADAHPTRVIPAGWTDPKALGLARAIELARSCVEVRGMAVVKMNPAQNGYAIDDAMVLDVVDEIVALGAIPAFHFGSDTPHTPPAGLAIVAERHPQHPLIAVHMGGGGGHFVEAEETYQAARRLGLTHSNIFYILSAIRDPHIESALLAYAAAGGSFAANLAAGSDAPYGNMIWNMGGFRSLLADLQAPGHVDPRLVSKPDLISDEIVANIMGGNLMRLIADAYERILVISDKGQPR